MKTLLQLTNIHKAYGAQIILDAFSVTISENQKIGVIGRNGAGKTTMCRIITGHEVPDDGTVQKSKRFRLAYLEQHDPYRLDETVISFLSRYTEKEEWQCGKVAARFQLKNELLETLIGTLSGGFRTRVKLVAMLLKDPNILILDEPTNYLDLKTLILLEEFLQDYRGGFLIVSHDREFLKKTCKETLEIENGSCALYPGTVDEYLLFKEEQGRLIDCHNKNVETKRKQLQAFVDRFRAKASKAAQAKSAMKKIEKLQTINTGHSLSTVRLKIPLVEKKNLVAFRAKGLTIGYPGHQVASHITMEFNQGDHIAVLGDNGQGKTTFMRTIAGDLEAMGGSYKWGHGLKVGYYAQHVLQSLDLQNDVLTHLMNVAEKSVVRQEILAMAGSFLFKEDDVLKKVAVLSGGEKARLCLASLLLSRNDVLLLDEPTNHLDFETVEAFGKALKAFNGTVFFISHDRTFVNMLATRIVEVKDG
ncbi:MAG: ABC-F family ATP-binding cassette domain-containing protein, partial [Candidatus Gorgyraea atricola]|nr:ABC-F family ATP-binding cassette domain-containing protein [Candidatus Gorgyraea atricola]